MRVFSTSIEASFSQTRRSPASRSRPEILRHNPAQSGYAIFRRNSVTPYSGTIRLRHNPAQSGYAIIRQNPVTP
jgi:hypothetical protein